MNKYLIPIYLCFILLFAMIAMSVYGVCTVTQSGPIAQDDSGHALVPLRFVYGVGQTADISANIPQGADPNFVSIFSSDTCNNLEAQATAIANAPGVGNIVPPPPISTGAVSIGP